MRVSIDFSCLAPFPPLSWTIDSSGNESALCHFAGQLSLSYLAHKSASGERKRGVRSIAVNYADVTWVGAHRRVPPLKESIKVRQLVFPHLAPPTLPFLFQRFNKCHSAEENCLHRQTTYQGLTSNYHNGGWTRAVIVFEMFIYTGNADVARNTLSWCG